LVLRFRPAVVRLCALAVLLLLAVAASQSSVTTGGRARQSVEVSMLPPIDMQTGSDRAVHVSDRPCVLHRRSHKHFLTRPDSVLPGDPCNDDGTSRDPDDDDDTTNDLSGNNDSDVPAIAWCHDLVCCLIGLEAGSRIASPETPSALFPGFQRLRC
jgi:hypothetical protein